MWSAAAHRPHRTLGRLAAWLRLTSPCVVCGIDAAPFDVPVCGGCERDWLSPAVARCAVCALRLPGGTQAPVCADCLREPPRFDATVALGDYRPPLAGMVLALKAGGRLALAEVFGALLARRVRQSWPGGAGDEATVVAAVPLAFERLAQRGFNQAAQIARRAARDLGLAFDDGLLLRVRDGAPQHTLAADERRRHVRGAFAVRSDRGAGLQGRRVLVVDDVMTSGATLGEIARVLKRAGAARVDNLVVARTP